MTSAAASSERVRHYFDPQVATRGDLIALRGGVTIASGDRERVAAIVQGKLPYAIELTLTGRERSALVVSCTCAHAARGLCKHGWAALRVAEQHGFLADARQANDLAAYPALVEPHAPEKRWVIDLVTTRSRGGELRMTLSERGPDGSGGSSGWRAVPGARAWREPRPMLAELAATGTCDVLVEPGGERNEPLVYDHDGPFLFVVTVTEGVDEPGHALPSLQVRGELRRGTAVLPLDGLCSFGGSDFVFSGARVAPVERSVRYSLLRSLRQGELTIAAERSERFLRDLMEGDRPGALTLPASFVVARGVPWMARVHVRRPGGSLRRALLVDVVFDYEGLRVAWNHAPRVIVDARAGRRIVVRDRDGEQRAMAELLSVGFRLSHGDGAVRLKITPTRLTRAVASLPAEQFVVEADGVVQRRPTSRSLNVTSGIDWFDVRACVTFGGFVVAAPALLLAARRGENVVRLDDGSVGILPSEWLARLARVGDLASMDPGAASDALRFSRAQVALVDALLADGADDGTATPGADAPVVWEGPLASLRSELAKRADLPPAAPPRGFQGTLREYQSAGLAWLQWLEALGLSGCLADDMGLGKTIQVLALLADRHHRGRAKGPSLVVAPRSVVHNWIDEARRFAPHLRVRELTSDTPTSTALEADLLVTTYGVVQRGSAHRGTLWFDYVVLDEAHAIKNAAAVTSKAVCQLRARHRLALTGTPVENHLGELAALFAFLNPGMLGPSVATTARAGLDLDPELAARLGRGLRPFILRRTKEAVLTDLPPRLEQTLTCTMEAPQRTAYDRLKRHYQSHLLTRIRADGAQRSGFQVLEALLRLRQMACHPGLVDPGLRREPSAKLELLLEHLEPLAAQGKKALVFSQFTTFLDLVEAALAERRIRSARLDGTTVDRKTPVATFQDDPACHVMLVSLKAGGVGLNLTAAEYVFVLDPWWNPAAEAQAIARAHRMGQQKTVIAYRLLCKDSIEERVAELQDRKRALATSIFEATEGASLGTLSVDEVEALLS